MRLAVQLGRQANSNEMTVSEVAADAFALVELGRLARRALGRKRNPVVHVDAAKTIARRYDAELFDLRDLNGTVMAIKFSSGLYSSGFRNLFFVA